MKKIFWLLLTLLLLTASLMAVAHANVTGAKYVGNISVNNTGEATTNIATVMSLAPQQLIDNFGLDFADVAILDSGGADVPFMPANNSTVPWVIWVPSIGSSITQNLNLYVSNVTDSTIYYFPDTAGMKTTDADSMEPSDNFSIEIKGYFDTDNGTDKYILRKDAAAGDIPVVAIYISATESGNITASIADNSSAYVEPTNFTDPDTQWLNETNVYDNDFGTYATESSVASKAWSSFLQLTCDSTILNGTKYAIGGANTDFSQVDIDSYYSSAWHNEFQGNIIVWGNENTVSFTSEIEGVTQLRFRFYNNNASLAKDLYFLECDFSEVTYTPHTISTTNIDSDEYTITTSISSDLFQMFIDGVESANNTAKMDSCQSGWTYAESDTQDIMSGTQPATDWFIEGTGSLKINGGYTTSGKAINAGNYAQFSKNIDFTDLDWMRLKIRSSGTFGGNIRVKIIVAGVTELEVSPTSSEYTLDVSDLTGSQSVVLKLENIGGTSQGADYVWFDNIYGWEGGLEVIDTDFDWVSFENDSMPCVEYQKVTVSGNLVQNVDWEYDTTFQDATDYNNDATPTFRTTSSDADVTANLISLQPKTQAVSTELPSSSWPSMLISAPTQPTTTYTEEERPGFFFEPIIHELLAFGNVPESFFWTNFCFLIILLAGMIAYWIHPSLILKAIIMGAIMIWFAAPGLNVYGQYVVLYFIFYCFGVIVISRSYGI